MTETDHGTRCDAHVGEVFPPRCEACTTAQMEAGDPRDVRPSRDVTRMSPGTVAVAPLIEWMTRHVDRANGDIQLAILYMQIDLRKQGTR
jgi:hypothetical protein